MERVGTGSLTPHMPRGLPFASSGVRFLLNFLPPCKGQVSMSCFNSGGKWGRVSHHHESAC